MLYKDDDEIVELVRTFEARTLAKSDWTHAAHLTVALFYSRNYAERKALDSMRDGICRLNDAHGTVNSDSSGYHETLTRFWMNAVRTFAEAKPPGQPLHETANAMISEFNDTNLPLRFYSRELLFSTKARREFVPPDIAAAAVDP
jgi:hypothetical protein